MLTVKDLAEWILDYPLHEQATLDEGTKEEMEIIYRCRQVINDYTTIGELFERVALNASKYRQVDLEEEYLDMKNLLSANSLLTVNDIVDKNDLPLVVSVIIEEKNTDYIHHYNHK